MKSQSLQPRKVESIFGELEKAHNRIMQRAHDLFLGRGGLLGRDLDDWLAAESELSWKPAVELREKEGEFVIEAAVAGFSPKDLDIQVTPEELLIKATTRHEHREESETIHLCEFGAGEMFRSIRFPKRIEPDKVKAEYKDGLLRISAAIAEAKEAKKIAVKKA